MGPEFESLPFVVHELSQKISYLYEVALAIRISAMKFAAAHLLYSSAILSLCAILGTT
jgi:hypothetical protein